MLHHSTGTLSYNLVPLNPAKIKIIFSPTRTNPKNFPIITKGKSYELQANITDLTT